MDDAVPTDTVTFQMPGTRGFSPNRPWFEIMMYDLIRAAVRDVLTNDKPGRWLASPPPLALSIPHVAELLDVSDRQVKRMIQAGIFEDKGPSLGTARVLISYEEVRRLLAPAEVAATRTPGSAVSPSGGS